jgi:ribosomal protein S24E
MKLTIQTTKEEPLLSRQRFDATVEFENAVPSRKDILKELAHKTNTDEKLVVVTHINPSFGSKRAEIVAFGYKNAADLARIEEKKKLAKTGFQEPKKEEAKPEGA